MGAQTSEECSDALGDPMLSLRRAAAGEIPGTIHDSQPIQQVAALDREQPVQFIAMGTSLAAAPGQ